MQMLEGKRVIMAESLGKKLAAARAARNWSLREVERRTGIHNAHLSQIETGAIEHYNRIIEATDGVDWVTQDMVIQILHDEEGHRRLFEGYLREYQAEGLA